MWGKNTPWVGCQSFTPFHALNSHTLDLTIQLSECFWAMGRNLIADILLHIGEEAWIWIILWCNFKYYTENSYLIKQSITQSYWVHVGVDYRMKAYGSPQWGRSCSNQLSALLIKDKSASSGMIRHDIIVNDQQQNQELGFWIEM